jgi:hypothetical protein
MPICENCGRNLIPGARFCAVCGTKVTPHPNICSGCGAELQADSNFCDICGTPVSVEFQASDEKAYPIAENSGTAPENINHQNEVPPWSNGYMPHQGTRPSQGVPYPPRQGARPPQGVPYPPRQGARPPQGASYPPRQGARPPQGASYPPRQGARPPQGASYPPRQGARPPQGVPYPPRQGANSISYTAPSTVMKRPSPPVSTPSKPRRKSRPSGGMWGLISFGILAVIIIIVSIVFATLFLKDVPNSPSTFFQEAPVEDSSLGKWLAMDFELNGIMVDMSEYYGDNLTLEIRSDGTFILFIRGAEFSGFWESDGYGGIYLQSDVIECYGTLYDDTMILENLLEPGLNITFLREASLNYNSGSEIAMYKHD